MLLCVEVKNPISRQKRVCLGIQAVIKEWDLDSDKSL